MKATAHPGATAHNASFLFLFRAIDGSEELPVVLLFILPGRTAGLEGGARQHPLTALARVRLGTPTTSKPLSGGPQWQCDVRRPPA